MKIRRGNFVSKMMEAERGITTGGGRHIGENTNIFKNSTRKKSKSPPPKK